jgi:hypothetical protein
MIDLLKRCAVTAIKLPAAVTWDIISLGNMGEGSSTSEVLQQHQAQADYDDCLKVMRDMKKITRKEPIK